MTATSIGLSFFFAWFFLAVPTFFVLLRAFNRTRMSAFLWLIAAIVVWPAAARTLSLFLPVIGGWVFLGSRNVFGVPNLSAYVVISLLETFLGGVLLLFAVYKLDQQLTERTGAPPPPIAG